MLGLGLFLALQMLGGVVPMNRRTRRETMNSAVQEPSDLQSLPSDLSPQPDAVVVLTAQTLLRDRSDITASLHQENFDLRYVAAWNRLPEAIDRVQADVVLIDMDAADRMYDGVQNVSGHRLVALLARQLQRRPTGLVVMTCVDFAEIEDLSRAGIHAIVSPRVSAHALIEQLHFAFYCARRRCDLFGAPAPDVQISERTKPARIGRKRSGCEGEDDGWRLPDELWQRIERLLPPTRYPERTRPTDRRALDAIFFILRSGISWSKLPKSLGPATTSRARVQYWTACGIMKEMLAAGLAAVTGWEHLHWDKLAPVFSPLVAHVASTEASQTDIAVQLPEIRELPTPMSDLKLPTPVNLLRP
jgi:transposase/AmiR/NasT family two-component response regulator